MKNSMSKTGHRRARSWGGWLRAATVTAGVAFAATAHAQVDAGATIPGTQSGVVSVPVLVRSNGLRATATKKFWISHKDCVDDIDVTFTASVSAPMAGKVLVAYVSNSVDDCLQNSTRNDPSRCRHLPVFPGTESSASPVVTFKAKALAAQIGFPNCGDDVADGGSSSTAPVSLKFYFVLAPPAMDLTVGMGNFAIYADSGVDLWGPEPPTSIVVTSGDEELAVSFTAGLNSAGDQAGVHFFVDDGSGDGGVPTTSTTSGGGSTSTGSTSVGASSGAGTSTSTSVGASTSAASSSSASSSSVGAGGAGGASTTAGVGGAGGASANSTSTTATGAGGTTASGAGGVSNPSSTTTGALPSTGVVGSGNTDACNPTGEIATCVAASSVLVPGEVPDNTGRKEVLTTGTVGNLTDLTNGKAVVVAMAAFDDVGNMGKLSELACGTPAPVDSFLRVYRCKGGFSESGCGFCSMSGDQGSSFAALVSGGLVVLGFMARRSRRPRVAGGSRGAR